jgi:hypothetical protein
MVERGASGGKLYDTAVSRARPRLLVPGHILDASVGPSVLLSLRFLPDAAITSDLLCLFYIPVCLA